MAEKEKDRRKKKILSDETAEYLELPPGDESFAEIFDRGKEQRLVCRNSISCFIFSKLCGGLGIGF